MVFTGKIKCSVCQKSFGVRRDIYDQRIESYGNEENLLAMYKCQKCRKVNATGEPLKKERKVESEKGNEEVGKVARPQIIFNPSDPLPQSWEEICSKGTACHFPNRFLDNDRTCNDCDINECCKSPVKQYKKIKQPKNIVISKLSDIEKQPHSEQNDHLIDDKIPSIIIK